MYSSFSVRKHYTKRYTVEMITELSVERKLKCAHTGPYEGIVYSEVQLSKTTSSFCCSPICSLSRSLSLRQEKTMGRAAVNLGNQCAQPCRKYSKHFPSCNIRK